MACYNANQSHTKEQICEPILLKGEMSRSEAVDEWDQLRHV